MYPGWVSSSTDYPILTIVKFTVVDDNEDVLVEYMVDGTTFSPEGYVMRMNGSKAPSTSQSEALRRTAEIGSLCNDAKIVYNAVSLV